MTERHGPPLLVTGLPRSGTSWTGKMLAAGGEVVYVNEPMNPRRPPGRSPGVLNASVSGPFHYVDPTDDSVWRAAFRDTLRLRYRPVAEIRSIRKPYEAARMGKYAAEFTLGRLRHQRALLDDPYAFFSSRWLTQEMGVHTVAVVRDPVGLLGSWQTLNWKTRLDVLLEQPALGRDLIGPWLDDIRAASTSDDWLTQMCCLWNVAHRVLDRFRTEVPSMTIVRYEDLASEPLDQFASVYRACQLEWSDEARAAVDAATSGAQGPKQGFSWSLRGGPSRTAFQRMDSRSQVATSQQRLAPEQVARIHELTGEVAALFPRTTG